MNRLRMRHRHLLLAAASSAWVLGLHVGSVAPGLLYLAPALLLLGLLVVDRYPGEWRLVRALARRRRRALPARGPAARPVDLLHVAGGRLIARALAGRAPPAPAARCRRPTARRAASPRPLSLRRGASMRRTTIAALAAGVLVLPAAADAHVTVNPKTAPAGAFTELVVRIPNEQDAARTTKVQLKLPPGFVFASYEPKPGWTVKVAKRKLAKPVTTDDGTISEEVDEITWTADGPKGGVGPGEFADLPLSVQVPGKAGDTLTFKAIQTYSNGEVSRWIGAEGGDHPAPTLSVTAAAEDHHGGAAADQTSTTTPAADTQPAASADDDRGDGASKGLGIAALVVGLLGLLTGGAALLRGGRRSA